MAKPSKENRFDDATKEAVAAKVLSGELSIDQARKECEATSYLVASWVGFSVENKIRQGYRLAIPAIKMQPSNEDNPAFTDTGVLKQTRLGKLTPQQRAVVELYVNELMSDIS